MGVSHDVLPYYSPDGTRIVFGSDRMSTEGTLDLFAINADGSGLTRIATGITVGGCVGKNCVSTPPGAGSRSGPSSAHRCNGIDHREDSRTKRLGSFRLETCPNAKPPS